MTDILYDYISMGVDMLIAAAIIAAVVMLLRGTTVLNAYSANQQSASERINYYKEYNKYDCTENLVSADVISAMLYYRYNIEIVIIDGDGNIMFTNKPTSNTSIDGTIYEDGSEVSVDYFRNKLEPHFTWKAYLYEDSNNPSGNGTDAGTPSYNGYQGGIVTGIVFKYTGAI